MKIFNWLKKRLIKIAILGIFLIPFFASAQWAITGPGSLSDDDLKVILSNVIVGVLGFVGLISILYLVHGGIKYIISSGNDSEMEEAKRTIMYAVFGLFLTASAYAIVKTVVAFTS